VRGANRDGFDRKAKPSRQNMFWRESPAIRQNFRCYFVGKTDKTTLFAESWSETAKSLRGATPPEYVLVGA